MLFLQVAACCFQEKMFAVMIDHHQLHTTWVLHMSSVTESSLVRPLKSAAITLISVSFS
jgi:hypothetical protein